MRSFLTLIVVPALSLATGLPPAKALPSGWSYSGCYADYTKSRVLSLDTYTSNGVTGQQCILYCNSKGYRIAGTEYAKQCFCGNALPSEVAASGCDMPCRGNAKEACGGRERLSVYEIAAVPQVTTNPGPSGWHSLGCYTDSNKARSLTVAARMPGNTVTVEVCTSRCGTLGYSLAGVEYGGECYCGNSIENGGVLSDGCNTPCKGNLVEYCGGLGRLNVYEADTPAASPSPPPVESPPAETPVETPSPAETPIEAVPPPPPAPTCGTTIKSPALLPNGGFEDGLASWTPNSRYVTANPLTGTAYEGCSSYEMIPGIYKNRYAGLTSNTADLPPTANSIRTLTFYAGRRSSTSTSMFTSIKVDVVPFSSYTKFVGQVCSGESCTLQGSNGSVWQKVEIPDIFWPWTQASIKLQVSWGDTPATAGVDDVLIDGVSFV